MIGSALFAFERFWFERANESPVSMIRISGDERSSSQLSCE